MTNPTPHGQVPEALRLADELCEAIEESPEPTALEAQAAAELRRLHAYCQELESQVILDCMTHVQNPAEIERVAGDVSKNGAGLNMSTQHARITELEAQLAQRFAATDMATAAQQGAAYAELPDLIHVDGEIWSAILDWKHAKSGKDALRKASELEHVLSDQMRAFADATHALRVESLAAAYCEELDKLSQRNYEMRLASHGQARADSVPKAQFDDPKVQAVYAILCDEAKPAEGEHWEGFTARRIVDALAADSVQEDAARYRWLRNQPFDEWKRIAWHVSGHSPTIYADRDAAIDAACKQGEKQ